MSLRVCRALLAIGCAVIAWSGALAAAPPAGADTVSVVALRYGDPGEGEVPITGDWDGSGKTQIGVYLPSQAEFFLGDVNGIAPTTLRYGDPGEGEVPITGDWDGSGKTQIGVYLPSQAEFFLGDVNGIAPTVIAFGNPGDVPITGDWNGSGRTQIGVYRPSTATFFLREVTPSPPSPRPVVTAPVAVPLPTPPAGTRRHPRVRVKITISWTWNHTHTRIHKVQVGKLPRRATITLKCSGRGCPMTKRSAKAAHLKILVRRLAGTRYRAGDVIVITVSAPGRVSERARIKIRNGRKPVAALL
jgi:hypothetical protein